MFVGCTDDEEDTLAYAPKDAPAHGTVDTPDPLATYTPTSGYSGMDVFSFEADDGHGGTATQRHEVVVTAPGANSRPVCGSGGTFTAANTPVMIFAFCSDGDGDPVTVSVVDGPDHGTMNGLIYTPAAGFNGVDEIVIRGSDAAGAGPRGVFQIQVGTSPGLPQPVCTAVGTTVEPGASRRIPLRCVWFLGQQPALFEIAAAPAHGTLGTVSGGRVTYTAAADYTGTDAFTYRGRFGASTLTAPADVTIDVRDVPDPVPPPPPPPTPGPPPPPPPGPETPPGTTPKATSPSLPTGFRLVRSLGSSALAAPTTAVRVPSNRNVTVAALVCPTACSMRWSAELRITGRTRRGRSSATRRVRFKGRLVSLPRGGEHRLALRLSAADRRRVRAAGKATIRLKLRVRNAQGTHDVVRSVTVR